MTPLPLSANEAERLRRLHELFVLDTAPEPVFDSLVALASEICGTPIALLTLLDADRQWFKANLGLPGLPGTPRDVSFCTHTILSGTVLEVPDTRLDARFADNPYVNGELSAVRFYAGAALVLPGGERVGALCVAGYEPGRLDATQARRLESLAAVATNALLMRRDLLAKAIAERNAHERALSASEAEYADLYANAPCGYHSIDADGRFVRINDTLLRWMGRTRAEVIGTHIAHLLTPEGVASFTQGFPELKAQGRLDDIQFDLIAKDGSRRSLLGSATAIRDDDGRFLVTRTATHDVTELRRMKAAHQELTAERNAILDTDLLGVMKVKDRHIAWCNPGLEHMLGYEAGELAGRSTRVLYATGETYERVLSEGYPQLRVGRVGALKVQLARKDGSLLWSDIRATVTSDRPSEPLCVMIDLTALEREQELRLRAAELEAENRRLIEAGRVNGVFLANMSHELYTPLNAIIGYSHVLQAGAFPSDSPKFAKYLGQIGQSAQQLLALIQAILDFADAESGKFELRPEAVDLREVIGEVIDTQHPESRQRGVQVSMAIDEPLGEIVIDELRLAQVVSLYLSNAIKFSHANGKVDVRARADGVDRFRIEVEDRGIGIPAADIGKLFVPFRQLSQGHAKTHGGTGLGLALTRRLVEAQGGQVGVDPRIGGSLFWLSLPRRPMAA